MEFTVQYSAKFKLSQTLGNQNPSIRNFWYKTLQMSQFERFLKYIYLLQQLCTGWAQVGSYLPECDCQYCS